MNGWLERLSDESHRSEVVAARWHRLHAWAYGGLIVGHLVLVALYVGSIAWHRAAAARHDRSAR